MAEATSKKPEHDLSQNKANVMLRKAAEGKYAVPGVCVVSLSSVFLAIGLLAILPISVQSISFRVYRLLFPLPLPLPHH